MPDIGLLTTTGLPGISLQSVGTLLLVRTLTVVLSVGMLTALARSLRARSLAVVDELIASGLAGQHASGQSNAQPHPYRIVVVTDDTTLAQWLRFSLKAAGFAVSVAGDGRQAINVVRQQPPDLLLIERQLSDGCNQG